MAYENISGRYIAKSEREFCSAVREIAAPTIIFQRPEPVKEKFRQELKSAFNRYARSVLEYSTIHLQPGSTSSGPLHQQGADLYRPQLNAMLKVAVTKLGFKNPQVLMTQDSKTLLEPAQKQRTTPVLMSYWDTAHVSALEEPERALLHEGDWGFFMPGARLPLHGIEKYNSSASIIIMPGGTWPEPAQS
ncbi:MAG: hypothetical protein WBK55_06650 [Alphaproteobacteria bacterium]